MDLTRWFSRLLLSLRALLHRQQVEAELDEELAHHLDHLTAEYRAGGLSANDARTAALRHMRGVELRKEECRAAWQVRALDQLFQDVRYGARALRRAPSFTAVAVLSLALGIGANSALFSLLNAVLLKPLPVRAPQQLVFLAWSATSFPGRYVDDLEGDCDEGGLITCLVFSTTDYQRLRQHNTVFADTLAFASNDANINLALRGSAQDALIQAVSGNYFSALGVRPALGRGLQPADDLPGAAPVMVVSYNFWQHDLAADPQALGRTLAVNGTPATVVGVAPPGFLGLRPGTAPALWLPISLQAAMNLRESGEDLNAPRTWWLSIVGRLKPGVSEIAARTQLAVIFQQGLTPGESPVTDAKPAVPRLALRPAAQGLEDLRRRFSAPLFVLAGMLGLVLLITCANIAGLLLTKAASRQPELALRVSLGAPRWRLVRQLLTESVLLSVLGGSLGLVVAAWLRTSLTHLLASGRTPVVVEATLDLRVLAFTAVLAIGCGIVFGLAPALRASRVEVRPISSRATGGSASAARFSAGKILVATQVAFSLVLLVGAGLFLRTLDRLLHVDLGFDQRHLVVFGVQPGLNGYSGARLAAYYQELERRVAAIPGVSSAGLSLNGPVAAGRSTGMAEIPGISPAGKTLPFFRYRVDPGFFPTLGLQAIRGRLLVPADTAAGRRVVVVNERLVADFMHGADPIGRTLQMGKNDRAEIVGVVRTLRTNQIREDAPAGAYLSYLQTPRLSTFMTMVVRCRQQCDSVLHAVEPVALRLDPQIPVADLHTETQVIERSLSLEHTFAILSGGFAVLAMLLACIGLYGTISYAVARRTHEIGVRMALGARRATILGGVLSETLWVVVAGLALGVPAAFWGASVLQSQLFGVSTHDPVTFLLASLPLVAAAFLAGLIPAHQASSVAPTVALRAD